MWIEGMWKVCKKCNTACPYYQDESLVCPDCGYTRELKNLGVFGKGVVVKQTILTIVKRKKKEELNLMDFLS